MIFSSKKIEELEYFRKCFNEMIEHFYSCKKYKNLSLNYNAPELNIPPISYNYNNELLLTHTYNSISTITVPGIIGITSTHYYTNEGNVELGTLNFDLDLFSLSTLYSIEVLENLYILQDIRINDSGKLFLFKIQKLKGCFLEYDML